MLTQAMENNPPDPTTARLMIGGTVAAVSCAVGCEAVPGFIANIRTMIMESRPAIAIRNATVVQRSGFTVNQTKALANFFGKGADGAKAAIEAARKPGFSLPKGLTEKTLQTYRDVATKAIESGKPAEVQRLRIEAIDKALRLGRNDMNDLAVMLSEVRKSLLRRGTFLNDGFVGDVETVIAQSTGKKAARVVIEMFKSFDGFQEGCIDGPSGIRIWPLRDVLTIRTKVSSSGRMVFGDFLMGSEDLSFDIENGWEPILYDSAGEQVAESLPDFLLQLAHGKLDFL